MKTIGIEDLLGWAFIHELPKGGGVEGLANVHSAWRTICDLGVRIDHGSASRPGGDLSDNFLIEQGEPHEDALTVGRAVAGLARCEVDFPEPWNPLADWSDPHGLAPAAVEVARHRWEQRGRRQRGEWLVSLVAGTAVLGREPAWAAEEPAVRLAERGGSPAWFIIRQVAHGDGRTYAMEVDGRNPRTRKPLPGAYRRHIFSTDPTGDIMGRLDYQMWIAALRRLEAELPPLMVAHRIRATERSATPWIARDMAGVTLIEAQPAKVRK